MTKYLVTKQNDDGSYDSVGTKNRAIFSGYKTYKNAYKFAINPFGRGRTVRVEVYGDEIYAEPSKTYYTRTFYTI